MEKLKRTPLRAEEKKKEKRQEKKKKNRRILIIGFSALFLVLALLLYINHGNRNYNGYRIISKAEWGMSLFNQCIHYKKGVLKYNKDGAEAIASNGHLIWNVAYNMKDPVAAVCGNYVAIGDRGGKILIIIDGSGKMNQLTLLHNITDVDISNQGIALAMTSDGAADYFYLYGMNSAGGDPPLADRTTSVSSDGYPLDAALSPDGKKVVTTYMKVEGDKVSTGVAFFNFGEVGKNFVDNMPGFFKFPNPDVEAIVPKVEFMNADTLLAFMDNGFVTYSFSERPKKEAMVISEEEILSMAYSEQLICQVVKNNSEDAKYRIRCYDTTGKKVSDFTTNTDYVKVIISENDIILYSRLAFVIYDMKGKTIMSGSFERNVDYIYPSSDKDKFLLAGDGYLDVLQLEELAN